MCVLEKHESWKQTVEEKHIVKLNVNSAMSKFATIEEDEALDSEVMKYKCIYVKRDLGPQFITFRWEKAKLLFSTSVYQMSIALCSFWSVQTEHRAMLIW